jgi:carbon-monoxide dehydrogenase medium subunit
MIPAPFSYVRAQNVRHAVALLNDYGDEAKLLAGGQSFIPILKLRLSSVEVVVDLSALNELAYLRDETTHIAIGALAKYAALEHSDLLEREIPLLRHAAAAVGDCQIRHRGTIGGSVAHGDPAADLPAALMALRATVVVDGPAGRRAIPMDEMYLGFLQTALRPGEVLVEIQVPKTAAAPWGFQKFRPRSIDWGIVGLSYIGGDRPGIGLVNMGETTLRAAAAEDALRAGSSPEEAAALADTGTAPSSDGSATAEYRRHLAKVLLRRALAGQAST